MHKCAQVCPSSCAPRASYSSISQVRMCMSSCAPRELIFCISQVCAAPHVPRGTKFRNVRMCPSSCAPRGSNSSISQVCAPPHVPRESQIAPFLKYVCDPPHVPRGGQIAPFLKYVLSSCAKFLNCLSMCPSLCAPWGSNFSSSQVCAPRRVPRGNNESPFLKLVPILVCPSDTKLLQFSSMCPSLCAPRRFNFSICQVRTYVPLSSCAPR